MGNSKQRRTVCFTLCSLLLCFAAGCGSAETPTHPLNPVIARSSVERALQAWRDGRKPADLKPDIIIGDSAWEQGRRLVDFRVLTDEETTDGSNLHIRVLRTFEGNGAKNESKITYIVGTHPVVTIFPQ